MRLIPLCFLLLLLFSCKKEEHGIPAIKIEWLDQQANYTFGSTLNISIEAEAPEGESIEKVVVQLKDQNQRVWLQSVNFTNVESHLFNGNATLIFDDPYLPSGNYYVQATAYTDHESKSGFINCSMIELPRKLKHVVVINNNGFAGAMIDTLSPAFEMGAFQSTLGTRYLPVINSRSQDLWSAIVGQTGMEVTNLDSPLPHSVIYPNAQSGDYCLDVAYDSKENYIWYSTIDGLRVYSHSQQQTQWIAQTNLNFISISSDVVCANQKTPGQPQRIYVYDKSSGNMIHTWVHGYEVMDLFCFENKLGLIVFENSLYKIKLFDLTTRLPILWHPLLNFNCSSFQSCFAMNNIWISDENGLHEYDFDGNLEFSWNIYHPTQIIADETQPIIWMIDQGKLKAFNYVNQMEVFQSENNGYTEMAVGYNK